MIGLTYSEHNDARHEGLSEDEAKIRTFKNLIPAYRQRIGDNDDNILKLKHENYSTQRQIDEMREFLKAHGQKEHTMAEWSKECGH